MNENNNTINHKTIGILLQAIMRVTESERTTAGAPPWATAVANLLAGFVAPYPDPDLHRAAAELCTVLARHSAPARPPPVHVRVMPPSAIATSWLAGGHRLTMSADCPGNAEDTFAPSHTAPCRTQ